MVTKSESSATLRIRVQIYSAGALPVGLSNSMQRFATDSTMSMSGRISQVGFGKFVWLRECDNDGMITVDHALGTFKFTPRHQIKREAVKPLTSDQVQSWSRLGSEIVLVKAIIVLLQHPDTLHRHLGRRLGFLPRQRL